MRIFVMPTNLSSLGIDRLSRDERLELVQQIWDTIAVEQPPILLSPTQREELQRRLEEDRANPNDTVPWEQVQADALARLKKS
jgi:putative addiction module component (TIGR02574 family)